MDTAHDSVFLLPQEWRCTRPQEKAHWVTSSKPQRGNPANASFDQVIHLFVHSIYSVKSHARCRGYSVNKSQDPFPEPQDLMF